MRKTKRGSVNKTLYFIPVFAFNVSLVKRDETTGVGGSDTRASVPDGLVGNSELSEVHSSHFGLDFNAAKHLSIVNSNDASDHLRDNDHVAEVGLNSTRLLSGRGVLLGSPEALDKGHRLALETTGHAPASTGSNEVLELLVGKVEKLIKVDSTEGELPEGALLTEFGNFLSVHI